MKKIIKFIAMGVLIIMSFGLFAGCGGNKNFVLSYDKMGVFGSKEVEDGETMYALELATSVQELQALCEAWGNPAFRESNEYYSSELSQKIRTYDDAFFSDKLLVIYSFSRGHSKETRIDSITIDGNKLVVNARYVNKRGSFTDEAFNWLMLIEISKADAAGAATVQVKHK